MRLIEAELLNQIFVRVGYYVLTDDLTDAPRRLNSCADGCLHGADIAQELDRHQAGIDLLDSSDLDGRCLHRRVRRFDEADKASCFDQSKGKLAHCVEIPRGRVKPPANRFLPETSSGHPAWVWNPGWPLLRSREKDGVPEGKRLFKM